MWKAIFSGPTQKINIVTFLNQVVEKTFDSKVKKSSGVILCNKNVLQTCYNFWFGRAQDKHYCSKNYTVYDH